MRTKLNLLLHTFIGLHVEIVKSSDRKLIGLKGTVVDETKNLLVIETKKKEVKIPKVSSTFLFYTEDKEKVEVEGRSICFRPEERPKKVTRN